MNAEPLHDSFQDWPLSPKKTPQSAKFPSFSIESPSFIGLSPTQVYNGWVTSQTPSLSITAPTTDGQSGKDKLGSEVGLKRPQPPAKGSPTAMSRVPRSSSHVPGSMAAQDSFPSGSFMQQFDNTSLEDPFLEPPSLSSSTPAAQMYTPPPTRDASSRKKPQQPRLAEFATPSTIVSRRMSVPSEPWMNRPSNSMFTDSSPFTYTPLQFSPSVADMGFAASGPMTAPAYPPNSLLWDPSSNNSLPQMPFSAVGGEPFVTGFADSAQPTFSFQSPMQMHQRSLAPGSFGPSTVQPHGLIRPQTARPADPRQEAPPFGSISFSASSSVDPSVLWTSPGPEIPSRAAMASTQQQTRQPYQYQQEELRREKEERSRQIARQAQRPSSNEQGPHSVDRALRRSFTDSRARRSFHGSTGSNASSKGANDIIYGLSKAELPREGSPLKRQKSDAHADSISPTKTRPRSTLVLVVDDSGHAKTEVRHVPGVTQHRAEGSQYSATSKSTSPDPPDSSTLGNKSISSGGFADSCADSQYPPGDARNALGEIVRERRQQKQGRTGNNGRLANETLPSQFGSTRSFKNSSPTTISNPDFQTPIKNQGMDMVEGIRCVCNGRPTRDGEPVIECDSCKNWQHVSCLALNPDQLPPVFVCIFCTGLTPATRGGRVRSYPGLV